MRMATSTASTASAPRKRLPKVSLRLSLAAGSALIPSALLCGVSKSSLGCQQVLRHLSRSLLSCEHSVCGLPLDLHIISAGICLPEQCSSELVSPDFSLVYQGAAGPLRHKIVLHHLEACPQFAQPQRVEVGNTNEETRSLF